MLGSVCSLISYTRSWVQRPGRRRGAGPSAQLGLWSEAIRRAMEFRRRVGEERFADVAFAALQADPVGAVAAAYDRLGLGLSEEAAKRMGAWSAENAKGSHGVHDYALDDFGLTASGVHDRFSFYTDRFDVPTGGADDRQTR